MNNAAGFGVLSYDLAHMLDGAALALSFMLLYQRRIMAVIKTYALQALVLAAAAGWQGWVQGDWHLYITAAITLVAKGVVIPFGLRRIVHMLRIHRALETALGIFPSLILGVFCVVLAVLVVLPTTTGAISSAREDLAMALSVVLLGLLMMITRRSALTQAIGFLSVENGLILAAIGVAGMPMVMELSVAVLVLVAFAVFGIFVFRIRERFDSLDVSNLDRITERLR
jgi:hydrogenase-4 component E